MKYKQAYKFNGFIDSHDFIYEIRNIQGKIIANGKGVGKKNIDLNGRSSGMFLILVETKNNISTQDFKSYFLNEVLGKTLNNEAQNYNYKKSVNFKILINRLLCYVEIF